MSSRVSLQCISLLAKKSGAAGWVMEKYRKVMNES
jgi:hypothetical protein